MTSHAIVDMRNANFAESWIDLQVKGAAYDLRLQRAYNSRTLFSGIFGFGWCSEFETTLKVTAENTLLVTECGAGYELEYRPDNYDKKSLDKNIQSILAEVRKQNKGREESYFKNLEEELRRDNDLRAEFAKQLNLTGKIEANARYIADGRTNDYIILKGNEYTRFQPNSTSQKFDKNGRLLQSSDKNNNFIKMSYKNDKLASVVDSTGASLQFKYEANSKFVRQIVGPGGLQASYKYNGENLVEVTNAWKNKYKHEYDDLYNMTKIVYPDNSYIALSYNKDKDWVTSFRDRKGCVEKYDYASDANNPLNNYSSKVQKTCEGKVTNTSSYEFWHKTAKNGSRYLARSKAVINGRSTETVYHEVFGHPTEIIQDGIISRFEYYPSGLLKRKTDSSRTYSYKYENPCGKVSHVSVQTAFRSPAQSGQKGVKSKIETRTLSTQFLYEAGRCNLMSAKNSDGQTVQISYDMRGRITRIYDQSKKEVLITYDERFGKPETVTRTGLGTIKFKYKADGTMDKFDSNQDPIIATQVANTFSNLLEIIAPATTDTSSI
jgi:YD repeat-containing protein